MARTLLPGRGEVGALQGNIGDAAPCAGSRGGDTGRRGELWPACGKETSAEQPEGEPPSPRTWCDELGPERVKVTADPTAHVASSRTWCDELGPERVKVTGGPVMHVVDVPSITDQPLARLLMQVLGDDARLVTSLRRSDRPHTAPIDLVLAAPPSPAAEISIDAAHDTGR
jgi:hypothetical protein